MKKILLILGISFFIVGCASTTPLPKCKGNFYPINGEQFK